MTPPTIPADAAPGLDRDACSLAGGIALAAAAMAPALAVVLNAPAAAPGAGGALPLAFLIAFLASLLVGNTVVSFARRLPPSAGSFYAYAARGLGPAGGFVTGWLLAFGYAAFAPGLFAALGDFAAAYVRARLGAGVPWWCFSLAGLALVAGLSLRGIRASVRVELVLLAVEMGVFLVLAAIVLFHAGGDRALAGFSVSASPTGWSGVGMGVVFGVLSFVGFDAAATLGEETRNARRNVPLAIGGTLAVCGLFYLVTVSALAAGGDLTGDNPFLALAHRHAPWLTDAVALCAIACLFSGALAVHNTTARVLFSMGRDRVLPGALGRVHPRWRSPHVAVAAQGLFTLAAGLPLGLWLGPGPAGAYGFSGAVGAVAIVAVWMLGGAALIRYSVRARERGLLRHVVPPALSVVVLTYPLWAVTTGEDAPGQAYRSYWVPAAALAWLVVGVAVFLRLHRKAPHVVAALGSTLADAPESSDAAMTLPPNSAGAQLAVRRMSRGELGLVREWAEAEGWNPGAHDATAFFEADPKGFFLGEVGGEPVACVWCVRYGGDFGFLGQYIVRPEYRGRGFGLAVWGAGMAHLAGRNVGLDGVPAQVPNYERSGFRFAHHHVRHVGTGGGVRPAGLVPLAKVPFNALAGYDAACFPARREAFLRAWVRLPGSVGLAAVLGGQLIGYGVLRPSADGFKVGPLFADDADTAARLLAGLAAAVPGRPFCIDIPDPTVQPAGPGSGPRVRADRGVPHRPHVHGPASGVRPGPRVRGHLAGTRLSRVPGRLFVMCVQPARRSRTDG